ncbi:protein RAI1 [Cryptococcus wingfieldii CBS 7118]|uniref:Decapping nuclease n=1 Tax=Cryptococcus wingfieldii CBS 7118 TaxID=1295528 RepID=A0A1E3K0V8_9TREE|nr:protein RAI1 [Cryptococcus wingfieldii CBS 7118]ODO06127.1 protein RAI1 [Cryptococcus wingfieldii CBS 7118]
MAHPIHLPLPHSSSLVAVPHPVYRQPHLIHTYSHNPDRSIVHDDSAMAWFDPAPIGSDLNYGFERLVERGDDDEHLDGLVESLEEMGRNGEEGERKGGIITWRGMLTRLLTSPYETRDGWEMTAFALDGSVYLELYDPPEARAAKKKGEASWARQAYMGYSYESWSTAKSYSHDESVSDHWGGDVNTNVQWANVVRSAIGDIPFCIAGEVDCVNGAPSENNPGLEETVELKTNKVIANEWQEKTFVKKLLKHWAQSWLLGTPRLMIGFRDDAGILRSQQLFDTYMLPRIAATHSSTPAWHPSPCFHALHSIASLLTTHILPTDPLLTHPDLRGNKERVDREGLPSAVVWRLRFDPRRGFELFQTGQVGLVDGRWGGVLKEDYVRWRMGV